MLSARHLSALTSAHGGHQISVTDVRERVTRRCVDAGDVVTRLVACCSTNGRDRRATLADGLDIDEGPLATPPVGSRWPP
jgi:hypothetical protein